MINKLKSLLTTIDIAALITTIIISAIVWWPTRYLPYHWDSAGFVINAAKNLVDNNFQPLIATNSDFSQPPLLIALLAIIWKLVGNYPLYFHIFMYPFYPLLVFSTYKLAKSLQNSILVSIAAAGAVAATPVVVAEYGMIYLDLPAAALSTTALWLWVSRKRHFSIAIFTAAVLTKISVITLMPLFILLGIEKPFNIKKLVSYPLVLLSIPIASVGLFFLYHFSVTGWILVKPGRHTIVASNLADFIESSIFVIKHLLISQGRWLSLAAILATASIILPSNKISISLPKPLLYIVIQVFIGIGFFAWGGEFAERYGIFLLPLTYIGSFWIVSHYTSQHHPHHWLPAASACTVILGLTLSWHPDKKPTREFTFRPPADLTYQDMILVHRKSANSLKLDTMTLSSMVHFLRTFT